MHEEHLKMFVVTVNVSKWLGKTKEARRIEEKNKLASTVTKYNSIHT